MDMRTKWVLSQMGSLVAHREFQRPLTLQEAELVETAWDEVFDWLCDMRDALKPLVDEAYYRKEVEDTK